MPSLLKPFMSGFPNASIRFDITFTAVMNVQTPKSTVLHALNQCLHTRDKILKIIILL